MRENQSRSLAAVTGLGMSILLASGCAPGAAVDGRVSAPGATMDAASIQRVTSAWHPAAREAVQHMTEKYGPPAEMTDTRAIWHETGPWKRTIINAEAVQHNFPMPHPDVFEQFIDYRVPPDKFDELAMYDGSVIVERTKGEMSARCDKEAANFLALNLADEIANGRRSVEDARRMYGEQIRMLKDGQMTRYTSGLMFTPPASGNDPDEPIM